jgi:hypothetical protein
MSIKPLNFQEAVLLINKYSPDPELSKSLSEKLSLPENVAVHEFLVNPLLVSLLFKAYEYKRTVPLKKHVFYRQVFEALFELHDLSKESGGFERRKETGLDIYSFELVLRAVGFVSLQTSKVEYTKDELLKIIEIAKKQLPNIDVNPQHLIQDLTLSVPLFTEETNSYRWNHKSLQEYFAALYVSNEGFDFQQKVLLSMYDSSLVNAYMNFFSLFADIDAKGFRYVLISRILEDILLEYNAPIFEPEGITPLDIHKRRLSSMFKNFVFAKWTEAEFQIINFTRSTQNTHMNYEEIRRLQGMLKQSLDLAYTDQSTSHSFQVCNPTVATFRKSKSATLYQMFQQGILNDLRLNASAPTQVTDIASFLVDNFDSIPFGCETYKRETENSYNSKDNYQAVTNLFDSLEHLMDYDINFLKDLSETIKKELLSSRNQTFEF